MISPIFQILMTHDHPSNSEDNQLDNPDDNFDYSDIYPDNLCHHSNNSKDSPDPPYTHPSHHADHPIYHKDNPRYPKSHLICPCHINNIMINLI